MLFCIPSVQTKKRLDARIKKVVCRMLILRFLFPCFLMFSQSYIFLIFAFILKAFFFTFFLPFLNSFFATCLVVVVVLLLLLLLYCLPTHFLSQVVYKGQESPSVTLCYDLRFPMKINNCQCLSLAPYLPNVTFSRIS